MLEIRFPGRGRRGGTPRDPEVTTSQAAGNPGEPIQGFARTDYRGTSILGWCIVAIGLGIMIFAVPSAPPDQRFAAFMTSVGFLFMGLLAAVSGAFGKTHQRKFGVSRLYLEGPAPRVAGTLAGRLVIPSGLGPLDNVRLRLACCRWSRMRGGGGYSHRDPVWLGEQRLAVRVASAGEIVLPFSFRIPPGLPATIGGSPEIEWRLLAVATVPGLDYGDQFYIHVGPAIHRAAGESAAALDRPILPVNNAVAPGLGTDPHTAAAILDYRVEADRRTGPFWPGWPGIGWLPMVLAGPLSIVPPWTSACIRVGIWLALVGFAVFAPLTIDPRGAGNLAHWGIEPLDTLIRVAGWSTLVLGVVWVTALSLRTWHKKRHLERHGISFLRMHAWPLPPGGLAQGSLEVPRRLVPRGGFAFRLLCVRTRWFQTWVPGPAVATAWTGPWSSFLGHDSSNGETEVPFELAVPLGPPESGTTEGSWQWYVETRARLPGLNYVGRFIVPVGHFRAGRR